MSTWNCSACTFANAISSGRCQICDTSRPVGASSVPARSSVAPSVSSKPAAVSSDTKEADIAYLTSMGISRSHAITGLQKWNSHRDRALDWCLNNAELPPNPVSRPSSASRPPARLDPIGAPAAKSSGFALNQPMPATKGPSPVSNMPAPSKPVSQPLPQAPQFAQQPMPQMSRPAAPLPVASQPAPVATKPPMPTPTAVKPSVVVAPAPTKSAAPAPAALASTHVVAALPAGAALGAKPAAPAFSGGSFALNAAVNKAAASMSSKAAAQPVVSKQDDSDVKAMIEKRKHDVEEQRRKKEEEESARRVALASEAQAQIDAALAEQAAALQRRHAAEAEIKSVDDAIESLLTRYGIEGLERTATLLCRLLDNLLTTPLDPKFCTINLKPETAQRALVKPLGALTILRLLGFTVNEEESATIAPAAVAKQVAAIKRVRAQLTEAVERPLTDIATRLQQVAKTSGADIAFYGAQELLTLVGTLRGQSNTITRRIDISLPYQARLRPHAPLESIVTQVLRFMPDPQSARHLMREKYLEPVELDFLKHLERDLHKWIAAQIYSTPIALALGKLQASNALEVFTKFVAVFSTAVGKIAQQPEETKFQRVKIDAMLKIVGADVKEWQLLFAAFGFQVQERPERVAQLPSQPALNVGVLQSRIVDLNTNVDRLLPSAATESGASWPTQMGSSAPAEVKSASWAT